MIRWILILAAIGVIAVGAGWLAENSGSVTIHWLEYRLDTSFAVLFVVVVVVAALSAFLYRLWRSLVSAPKSLGSLRQERRQRKGYEALSRGLVAVAAGDADSARRQAKRADSLIEDRPLTMLLSAQAAQLEGDEKAAEKFFASMQEQRATEFLGVRGLLSQAMKREDWPEALKLARRAYRLNPKSEWVVQTLYDLQKRAGEWTGATETLEESVKRQLIPAGDAKNERAELLYKASLEHSDPEAIKWARKAFRADPGYVPAAVRYARMLVAEGSMRKASSVIEGAWEQTPDPELAEVYWLARKCDDALQKVQAAQRLAKHNPKHPESRITVAVAALEARLWGEARGNLEPLAGDDASPRVCRLMAELEEAEHGDLARARSWLLRATADEHGPEMSSPVPQMVDPAQ
jgi:HemY protein